MHCTNAHSTATSMSSGFQMRLPQMASPSSFYGSCDSSNASVVPKSEADFGPLRGQSSSQDRVRLRLQSCRVACSETSSSFRAQRLQSFAFTHFECSHRRVGSSRQSFPVARGRATSSQCFSHRTERWSWPPLHRRRHSNGRV